MKKPEITAGVVQGAATPVGGTIPNLITKYVDKATTTGVKKNGIANHGFITNGRPNKNGSLMLKRAGTSSTLPIDLNWTDLAPTKVKITKPIVMPEPVKLMKLL